MQHGLHVILSCKKARCVYTGIYIPPGRFSNARNARFDVLSVLSSRAWIVGHIKLVSIGCGRKRSFGFSFATIYGHRTYVAFFFSSFLFGGVSCLKRAFRARFCRRRGQSETCVSQEVTRLGIVSVARHTCPKVTTNDRKSVSALATPNPSSPDFSQPVMWFQRQTFEQGPGHQRTDQKGRRPKCKH